MRNNQRDGRAEPRPGSSRGAPERPPPPSPRRCEPVIRAALNTEAHNSHCTTDPRTAVPNVKSISNYLQGEKLNDQHRTHGRPLDTSSSAEQHFIIFIIFSFVSDGMNRFICSIATLAIHPLVCNISAEVS